MALPIGNDYELHVQQFPQPPGTLESAGIPSQVTAWVNDHPSGTQVPAGTVDKMVPPIFLGALGNGNPMWLVVYFVILAKGH